VLVVTDSTVVILVNTFKEATTMNAWNRLLTALDEVLGFPNKTNSNVKKIKQAYDNRTNEHVIWLEYRVRVSNEEPVRKGILESLVNPDS
jgi:hypothetical protein